MFIIKIMDKEIMRHVIIMYVLLVEIQSGKRNYTAFLNDEN